MKKLTVHLQKLNGPYRDFVLRCLISLVAGHCIVVHASKYNLFNIVQVKGYYPSMLSSALIAFCLVMVVYAYTIYLDQKLPYAKFWLKRIVWQILLGIIGVSLLAIALATAYFYVNAQTHRLVNYWIYDFPVIFAFIVGLNMYYAGLYLIGLRKQLEIEVQQLLRINRTQKLNLVQQINSSDKELGIDPDDIAFIYTKAQEYHVVHLNQKKFLWFKNMKESLKQLPKDDFYLINQSCIIHRVIILDYTAISSRRFLLKLKAPFQYIDDPLILVVSQLYARQFLNWYHGVFSN